MNDYVTVVMEIKGPRAKRLLKEMSKSLMGEGDFRGTNVTGISRGDEMTYAEKLEDVLRENGLANEAVKLRREMRM